jgi:hypothetical protein
VVAVVDMFLLSGIAPLLLIISTSTQLPVEHFLTDLKLLNGRSSKHDLSRETRRKIDWLEFFQNNPQYTNLYTDCEKMQMPVSNLIKKVGKIKRSKMERMIYTHPELMHHILSSDMSTLRSISSQLDRDLEVDASGKNKLENASKKLTTYRGNTRSIVMYFRHALQMDRDCVAKTILKAPQILNYSFGKIEATVKYLQSRGFSDEFIAKMIGSRPMIVGYSIEKKIRPILDYLEVDLGIEFYHKLVARYPQVLTIKVDGLINRSQFLKSNLNVGSAGAKKLDVSYMISGFPPVLWLSEENLSEKVNFLQNQFAFEDYELRDTMVTYPQILGLAIETNLQPKIAFLLMDSKDGGAGLTFDELKELVMYQPAILGYSLEKRILPRIRRMKENYISLSYAPPTLLSFTNAKFDQW